MSSLSPPPERPAFFRSVSGTSQLSTRSSKSLSLSRTFSHKKDKLRLYIALLPRGGACGGSYRSQMSCDSYHWALLVAPKSPSRSQSGMVYHIVHSGSDFVSTPYFYEEADLSDSPHLCKNVLVRVALAKIVDEDRVAKILRGLAPDATSDAAKASTTSFDSVSSHDVSCVSWVKTAWQSLSADSKRPLKTYFGPSDWDAIESRTRKYIKRKRAQGRYQVDILPVDVTWNTDEICTWNYWENRETTN